MILFDFIWFIFSFSLFAHLCKSAPQSCGLWWGCQSCQSRWLWHCPWSHMHPGGVQGCCPSSFSTYEIVKESRGMCKGWKKGRGLEWMMMDRGGGDRRIEAQKNEERRRERWRENSVPVHLNENSQADMIFFFYSGYFWRENCSAYN